ncbi:hypothetical protein G6F56_006501 [Rhizopus delemar]|uniref:Uncharacterized protein n=1 Tax=Rhizopus stolonifer TaxID=4846 RepID=A0A367J5G3_RHIST|nr:hypothetical protein G6F56_006501 [Rhizopus delemar]RCH85204.1 hypothetical protein CU098_003831 [Rhizopus stolonifer]
MNSLVNNLFQNYISQHQPNHNGNLMGSGPMDWLLNTAAFTGADTLLNKMDDEEGKNPHVWRNAGVAGALALAYQWYRNHHQQQQQLQQNPQYMYYTQPYPTQSYYPSQYAPPPPQQYLQYPQYSQYPQQYPVPSYDMYNSNSYMIQPYMPYNIPGSYYGQQQMMPYQPYRYI